MNKDEVRVAAVISKDEDVHFLVDERTGILYKIERTNSSYEKPYLVLSKLSKEEIRHI